MDASKLSPKEKEILEKMKIVVDPEINCPITDMELLDEIKVEGNKAKVTYHLTAPFCPPVFALYIGRQIKEKAKEVPGISDVKVVLQNHMKAKEITETIEREG